MTAVDAQWMGRCPACDTTIYVGDRIVTDPLDGDEATWMHETCPPERKPRPVCTECFMETSLNGTCGCAA